MSKKVEKSPKKGGKQKNENGYPTCINKKQARMVCLNQQCEQYPFFCSNCEESQCEIIHQHNDDKLVSVSYKQFTKRVLKQRKPIDALGESMESYKKVLQKLKEDVSQFIQKELANLEQIQKKAAQIDPADSELVEKLKTQQYEGFTGAILDGLWSSCAQDPQKIKSQQQTAQFIKIKQQQVRGISQHFEHLNKMQIDGVPDDEEEGKDKKGKNSNSNTKPKK